VAALAPGAAQAASVEQVAPREGQSFPRNTTVELEAIRDDADCASSSAFVLEQRRANTDAFIELARSSSELVDGWLRPEQGRYEWRARFTCDGATIASPVRSFTVGPPLEPENPGPPFTADSTDGAADGGVPRALVTFGTARVRGSTIRISMRCSERAVGVCGGRLTLRTSTRPLDHLTFLGMRPGQRRVLALELDPDELRSLRRRRAATLSFVAEARDDRKVVRRTSTTQRLRFRGRGR